METTAAPDAPQGGTSDNALGLYTVVGIVCVIIGSIISVLTFLFGPGVCKKCLQICPGVCKKKCPQNPTPEENPEPGPGDQFLSQDVTDGGNSSNQGPIDGTDARTISSQDQSMAANMQGGDSMEVTTEQLRRFSRVYPEDEIVSLKEKLRESTEEARTATQGSEEDLFKILTALKERGGFRSKLLAALTELNFPDKNAIEKILSTQCQGEAEQEQLEKIAKGFPSTEYVPFCRMLGCDGEPANSILKKHRNDYREALMEILMAWKNRTGGPCSDLEFYLIKSGGGHLTKIIYT